MNFDEFDSKMRVYEQSMDQMLLPELYLAARLDGNRFTRLTKEVCHFEVPFDMKFRDMMVETVKSLMNFFPCVLVSRLFLIAVWCRCRHWKGFRTISSGDRKMLTGIH